MMANTETARSEDSIMFSRIYRATEVPANGVTGTIDATNEQCVAIAETLGLIELKSFEVTYTLHCSALRRFKLVGQLTATVVQSCVITLEPVENRIVDEMEIEYWPAEDVERLESDIELDGMDVPVDGPEPLPKDGLIDAGHVAYEHLAAALDPYPRKPGVQFESGNANVEESEGVGNKPFAHLDVLLNKKGPSAK